MFIFTLLHNGYKLTIQLFQKRGIVMFPLIVLFLLIISMVKTDSKLESVFTEANTGRNFAAIETTLKPFLNQKRIIAGVPGMSIAVVSNGQLLSTLNGGRTTALMGSEVNQHTVFEAASLSKPLTAWAIMRLVKDKRLQLDSVITTDRFPYTIRQLLSHSAGFNNQLGAKVEPHQKAGAFVYAGQGFMKLGEIIEQKTGMSYASYMNHVVLKELGMNNSYFDDRTDQINFAFPHISATMPIMIGCIIYLVTFGIVVLIARLFALFLRKRFVLDSSIRHLFCLSVLMSLIVSIFLVGYENGIRFALVNMGFLGLLLLLNIAINKPTIQYNLGSTVKKVMGFTMAVAIVSIIYFQPPVPLQQRKALFLPAAGLKTTAEDYARFLIQWMQKCNDDALFQQMMSSQADVNAHYEWGLGMGIQKGKEQRIWHWGVNFPGYQSLFIASPQRKEAVVVLMNGGPMYFTPGNFRFGGLELARDLINKVMGGVHHGYWQEIQ